MKPQITIVSKQDEPLLQELLVKMQQRDFRDIPVCERPAELKEYLQSGYKGFFIFRLSPQTLKDWYGSITREDDPLQRRPDTSLAKEKLQWQPVVPLQEGLTRTIIYFEKLLIDIDL